MGIPYDLDNPLDTFKLPRRDVEISGIWPLPARNALLFVQDEVLGIAELDLFTGKITRHPGFAARDAEDVVLVGDTAYVLVAGEAPAIYRIRRFTDPTSPVASFSLRLDPAYDPEGLALDAGGERLLVACKGSPLADDPTRQVYTFDLKTCRRSEHPLFTVDSRGFLDVRKECFHPSGIAVHPASGDIYLVGTRSVKMILRCDAGGRFVDSVALRRKRFRQPEGIAFGPDGDLFVCSEGVPGGKADGGKKARVYRFPPAAYSTG